MNPQNLGRNYDKIARWWHDRHRDSRYGMEQLEKTLRLATGGRSALDIGCGAGGRMIRRMQESGLTVTGIDVSEEMICLAVQNHPDVTFHVQDIYTWETGEQFDLIVAWDSLFHLPREAHHPVIDKLCALLNQRGILMYTFGDAVGEHTDTWHDDEFYYSSIGVNGNLTRLMANGMTIRHLELDQFPEKHAYVIAAKT